jgi:hypothetical protein
MARAALRWTIGNLSLKAKVARMTIGRIENGLPTRRASVVAVRKAIERTGIQFLHNEDGTGAQLRHAAECVNDLVSLASDAIAEISVDTAMKLRLERFRLSARTWQSRWPQKDESIYSNELKKEMHAACRAADPRLRRMLRKTLTYLD